MSDKKSDKRSDMMTTVINFIVDESSIPRVNVVSYLTMFGQMYDLDALLRYYKQASEQKEDSSVIYETIMHDLRGVREDPNTFNPRSASY
jgi:hypothetical protein